jgi:formate/nitrite transporter FocA (FNT family)
VSARQRQSKSADNQAAQEEEQIESRSSPNSRIVHDAVLKEGEEELRRPSSALAWSGLAAGLSMGFSLIAEALLQAHLPDTPWRPLISKLGYSVGFVLVILGRQQLFTENTLTPILPLLERKDAPTLRNVARLWCIVLVANLVGCVLVGWAVTRHGSLDPHVRASLLAVCRESTAPAALTIFWRGIFAGWLIALLVWLLPFAEAGRFWVILLLTYVIGLGKFSHVIAGSVEVAALASLGKIGAWHGLLHFTLPCLAGNIIGGVALVAVVNHAQAVAGNPARR